MKITPLVSMIITGAMLFGCGKTESGGGPTVGTPTEGSKLKVVYIPKSTGNPYFDQIEAGYVKAAAAFNFEFQLQAPATAEATSQLSVIKDQIQRGVDVIGISPNSPDALNEALDEARAKGIVVVTVDADLTGNETHRDAAVLPTDFAKVGPSQLELLGELTGYAGEFAILSATTDAPNQNAWIEGIKKSLSDSKYSKMKLVTIVYGDDESQKSATEAESLLTKFPNLKGIISPTSVGLAAAAQVLDNAGVYPGGPKAKNGGVFLTGLSTPNQLREAVEKGVVQKFQLWSPQDAGFMAGYIGTQLKLKKVEMKTGLSIDIPGASKVEVQDKNIVYTGPLLTFDKSNIGNYRF